MTGGRRRRMGHRRLLFLNNQGLGSVGGGVTILRRLVEEFAPDHDVIVASQDPPGAAPPGVRQIRLAPYATGPVRRFAAFARAAQMRDAAPHAEIAGADVVVALDCHFGPALRRTVPRRLVYLSLSCLPRQEWFGGRGGAAALAFVQYAWLERRIARAADAVVVASALHARELRRYEALPGLRVEVIHPVFGGAPQALRTRGHAGPLRLLAAGRLVPGKGFRRLVDMMDHLRDVDCRLVIAGEGPEAQALAAQVAALGLGGRIEIAGASPSLDTPLAAADLFLHPSHYESFGIAVFEAQRAGVPPLCDATAVAGYREIVDDGVDGLLVDFRHPDRAAATVRALAADPSRRRALSEAAARSAAARASHDHARRFRALIDRLLTAPPAR